MNQPLPYLGIATRISCINLRQPAKTFRTVNVEICFSSFTIYPLFVFAHLPTQERIGDSISAPFPLLPVGGFFSAAFALFTRGRVLFCSFSSPTRGRVLFCSVSSPTRGRVLFCSFSSPTRGRVLLYPLPSESFSAPMTHIRSLQYPKFFVSTFPLPHGKFS